MQYKTILSSKNTTVETWQHYQISYLLSISNHKMILQVHLLQVACIKSILPIIIINHYFYWSRVLNTEIVNLMWILVSHTQEKLSDKSYILMMTEAAWCLSSAIVVDVVSCSNLCDSMRKYSELNCSFRHQLVHLFLEKCWKVLKIYWPKQIVGWECWG